MGISSFTCAKTNLPIIVTHEEMIDGKNMNDVVFYPGRGESPIRGWLGQYATFEWDGGSIRLWDEGFGKKLQKGEAKLALADFLEDGDGFDTIGQSHLDPGQGGATYDEDFVARAVMAGGFKTFAGLELAHSADVPVEIATQIDDEAAARYETLRCLIGAGYEEATLERIPEKPESGDPGRIGEFFPGRVAPLDSQCTKIAYARYGSPQKTVFEFVDGAFTPDPKAFGRTLAGNRGVGAPRTATFEGEDGTTFVVKTYDNLYTVEGSDRSAKAFVDLDKALNSIGFELRFPAELRQVDPDAYAFFDYYGKKPETGTFSLPSTGTAPRP